MESKELRIGNYVQILYADNDWRIYDVKVDTLAEIEIYPENIKPIKLNEKWLLDFGFEIIEDGSYELMSKKIIIAFEKEDNFKEAYISELTQLYPIHWINSVKIKFVHQLQNLYFALTGKELKLKVNNEKKI